MRKGILAIGIILIFIGLALLAMSRQSTIVDKSETPLIATSQVKSTEVSFSLNKSDKFFIPPFQAAGYQDGGIDDVIVHVDNPPPGNQTIILYKYTKNGIIANYTGNYRIQLTGLLPGQTFTFQVRKFIEKTETQYPNSYLLPFALAFIAVGIGTSILGAKTSKRSIPRRRLKQK